MRSKASICFAGGPGSIKRNTGSSGKGWKNKRKAKVRRQRMEQAARRRYFDEMLAAKKAVDNGKMDYWEYRQLRGWED